MELNKTTVCSAVENGNLFELRERTVANGQLHIFEIYQNGEFAVTCMTDDFDHLFHAKDADKMRQYFKSKFGFI